MNIELNYGEMDKTYFYDVLSGRCGCLHQKEFYSILFECATKGISFSLTDGGNREEIIRKN